MVNNLFGATLQKTAAGNSWTVGGVASGFFRDLDGDAIAPQAVAAAIPDFMANRGPDGLRGGPIRLHHNFWQPLIQRAIALLSLDANEQMDLVASIALPLGRVTEIWVDADGDCHWRGILSQRHPVARCVWGLLQENAIALGVSVGGKILRTQPGRDRLGRPCNIISAIRLDELSITDNPALRLVGGENPAANGAYITALAKSLGASAMPSLQPKTSTTVETEAWLAKALGSTAKEISSANSTTTTGLGGKRGLSVGGTSQRPRGSKGVKMDSSQSKTGLGETQPKADRRTSSNTGPKTDVWGMTVSELTQKLAKCATLDKSALGDPETIGMLTDSAYGLAGLTPDPPPELINMVRFLQYFCRYAQELPTMDPWQAEGTVPAMGIDLTKALASFKEGMPKDLMGQPLRPPGGVKPTTPFVAFPTQYVQY